MLLLPISRVQFSSVQSLSHIRLFATPWTAAHQASLYITNSRSLLKLMSIELVMPSNYLILCHPLLLLPSIFPSIRVFSNESVLGIRWPKDWSFSFNISPSSEHPGLISLQSRGLSRDKDVNCDVRMWTKRVKMHLNLSCYQLQIDCCILCKSYGIHSSVLVWRIPGTGEPGGLPSMGLHRVGHD